ncbi:conserved hypothetical protein [Vibrio owensii]|nr:conserved hypothetical protein [Vibrio owensii]CAH1578643.1 conserved hypothetical protein [Vibrio owensii]
MVPTLLVCCSAWNLSMAMGDVIPYFGNPTILSKNRRIFAQKYWCGRHDRALA